MMRPRNFLRRNIVADAPDEQWAVYGRSKAYDALEDARTYIVQGNLYAGYAWMYGTIFFSVLLWKGSEAGPWETIAGVAGGLSALGGVLLHWRGARIRKAVELAQSEILAAFDKDHSLEDLEENLAILSGR